MVTSRRDYGAEAVAAAKSVLVELVQVLGEFRDQIVVVGGWVPGLLLAGRQGFLCEWHGLRCAGHDALLSRPKTRQWVGRPTTHRLTRQAPPP